MTKSRLRIIVVLAVLVLLSGLGVLVARVMWQHGKAELAERGLQFLPDVAQRLQDFHRVQVRDGRKVWEIAASEARYFDREQKVVVRGPSLRLYLRDGRSVGVTGEQGMVQLDGKELQSVQLTGGIEVDLSEYTVRTESASYERNSNTIIAPGEAVISGGGLEARGDRMQVDLEKQHLQLANDVHMTLRPTDAGETPAP